MTSKDLFALRKALPKGSKAIIAQKMGLSEGYINLVLQGHRKNDQVIIAAAEIVSEHKKKLNEAVEFVSSLE